jgi:hypothetical protein
MTNVATICASLGHANFNTESNFFLASSEINPSCKEIESCESNITQHDMRIYRAVCRTYLFDCIVSNARQPFEHAQASTGALTSLYQNNAGQLTGAHRAAPRI